VADRLRAVLTERSQRGSIKESPAQRKKNSPVNRFPTRTLNSLFLEALCQIPPYLIGN
jgi:hypothetical protein